MKPAVPLRAIGLALAFGASVALGAALIDDDPTPVRGDSGMGKPANWGAADQKTPRPEGPIRRDLQWFQELVDATPAGGTLKPPAGA